MGEETGRVGLRSKGAQDQVRWYESGSCKNEVDPATFINGDKSGFKILENLNNSSVATTLYLNLFSDAHCLGIPNTWFACHEHGSHGLMR